MIDILVYSETQQGIIDMVNDFGPEADVRYDWMPPGTVILKVDEGEEEYSDNWHCNLRFLDDDLAKAILFEVEQAYDDGDVIAYPSQRRPGENNIFPYLNRGYDENVYFTRNHETGDYLPLWPRRMWVGGMRTE